MIRKQNFHDQPNLKILHTQARTQDFEKGGGGYHVAVRPRRGGGCGRAFTLWMI